MNTSSSKVLPAIVTIVIVIIIVAVGWKVLSNKSPVTTYTPNDISPTGCTEGARKTDALGNISECIGGVMTYVGNTADKKE